MNEDWTESEEWKDFKRQMEEGAAPMIRDSHAFVALVPEEADIKAAVELGLAILMDKPIVSLVMPGREIPERLRRASDMVIEGDLTDPDVQKKLHYFLHEFAEKAGEE